MSKRKPRVLRNLRAYTPAPVIVDAPEYEIIHLTPDDVLPCQHWRCGWWWWSFANPGEEYEDQLLPSRPHGPFKTERRARQAATTFHIAAYAAA
jgi:hypothetical protein